MHLRKRAEEPRLQTLLGTIWRISFFLFFLSACADLEQEKPVSESQESIDKAYSNPSSLIEVDALQPMLKHMVNKVLIDVRKPEDFATGHIGNAVNIWRNQITDTSYNYGGMMATMGQMEQLLSKVGILPSDTLIIYDAKADVDAARLWWILKYYGHDQVKLLNGGLKAWKAFGGKLDSVESSIDQTTYQFKGGVIAEIHASVEEVKFSLKGDERILLDTRSTEEFSGEMKKKGAARAGAIPTSVNLDWSASVNYEGDHRFRSSEELKEIYGDLGIDGSTDVISYCHSGVRSAHTLFVLTELLGYQNVQNYDGSWTEWSHLKQE